MEPLLEETGPDANGMHYLVVTVGSCELCGYRGPRKTVAAFATEDGIAIEGDAGHAAVLVNVRTLFAEDRRKGLASAAARAFLEYLRRKGVQTVFLRAAIQDEPWNIIEWYRRLGFQISIGSNPHEPQMWLDLQRS